MLLIQDQDTIIRTNTITHQIGIIIIITVINIITTITTIREDQFITDQEEIDKKWENLLYQKKKRILFVKCII
jgi:hypothetical protein